MKYLLNSDPPINIMYKEKRSPVFNTIKGRHQTVTKLIDKECDLEVIDKVPTHLFI